MCDTRIKNFTDTDCSRDLTKKDGAENAMRAAHSVCDKDNPKIILLSYVCLCVCMFSSLFSIFIWSRLALLQTFCIVFDSDNTCDTATEQIICLLRCCDESFVDIYVLCLSMSVGNILACDYDIYIVLMPFHWKSVVNYKINLVIKLKMFVWILRTIL